MSWLHDMRLRDLDDTYLIETTCLKCRHTWLQTPEQLLAKVEHRDMRMAEIAERLVCTRFKCRHPGARLILVRNEETSGFVAGMP